MLLYLLRHGDADSDFSMPDDQRALTPLGFEQVKAVAQLAQTFNIKIDVAYSSPFLRASQTAETFLSEIGSDLTAESTLALVNGSDYRSLFKLLASCNPNSRVLLVGHEPYMSQLISTLLTGHVAARVEMRKGALACLEVAEPVGGGGALLKWLIPTPVG